MKLRQRSLTWAKAAKPVSVKEGKRCHKRTSYDTYWKVMYPWTEEVKDDGMVIGIVCSVFRENINRIDPADLSKSKSVFVNVPFSRWDKGRENLFKHEFGDPDDESYPKHSCIRECGGPSILRKRYVEEHEEVSGFKVTSHMQFYKDKEIKDKVEAEGQSISNVLGKMLEEIQKSNLLCIQMLIEVTKLCLEMRVAPFNNFKKLVDFMVDHKAEDLARMKRWAKNATYVSNLSVDSYIQAIYQTVCYGMWKEMCSTMTIQDESPVFALMIDTATTLKTDQHVAVGVKYISLDAKECSERVLAVNGCKDKSGEGLVNAIKVVVNNFNDEIENLWESCPWLFRFERIETCH